MFDIFVLCMMQNGLASHLHLSSVYMDDIVQKIEKKKNKERNTQKSLNEKINEAMKESTHR